MRLSTSSTKYVPLAWFVVTFGALLFGWEAVIRANYNPPLGISYQLLAAVRDDSTAGRAAELPRRWVIVGNCLPLQGLSPRSMLEEWHAMRPSSELPLVLNISRHEHAPQAFLAYFQMNGFCPDVIIANVSSWINSDSFRRETQDLERSDPLGLRPTKEATDRTGRKGDGAPTGGEDLRKRVEQGLDRGMHQFLKLTEKRYHLFDFSAFLVTLLTTGDLKDSLYDLNLQSWFKVMESIDDGLGYRGVRVEYESDWDRGVQVMASKHIKRLMAGRFLTPAYWNSLSEQLDHFRRQGARILLLRMPEYPAIYQYNEARYRVTEHLEGLATCPGVAFLDLNSVGYLKHVKLYDVVHPDREGSLRISEYVARWLAEQYPDWVYRETR